MNILPHDKRLSFILQLVMTALVLIGMLYFGIRLKGFRPGNKVQWAHSGVGLSFSRFALAYTDGFFSATSKRLSKDELTIELAIQPGFSNFYGFKFIALVHDGEDKHQLVIGQWRSFLVIMNGNDFSNRHGTPKIYFQLDEKDRIPHLITIVSNKSGTKLILDGTLKKRNPDLFLRYPNRKAMARLVVGNSLNGNNPWIGKILGLAFYDRDLEDDTVLQHYHTWRRTANFSTFKSGRPRLLYVFDEGKGEKAYNKIGDGLDLIVPPWMKVLRIQVLSWPRIENFARTNVVEDILINLAGFVPLGFLFVATITRLEGIDERTALKITLLFAFTFSLCIELIQVWIPSRDSSMLDLIFNTLGAWMGILLFKYGPMSHKKA